MDLDDRSLETPEYSPVCSLCRHLSLRRRRACAAFSQAETIPLEIWLGQHDHRTPYPGDGGVMFAPRQAEE